MVRTKQKKVIFQQLRDIFDQIGFKKDDIIVMNNITAGDYLVANPSKNNFPRFLCLFDTKSILKIECGQLKLSNYKNIKKILNSRFLKYATIIDYVLIDESTGYILDESSSSKKDIKISFERVSNVIEKIKEESSIFKFEFNCKFSSKNISNILIKNEKDEVSKDTIQLSNDINNKIIQLIYSKNKNIQSKQLLTIFPKWDKIKALNKLKKMVDEDLLERNGSWFKIKN